MTNLKKLVSLAALSVAATATAETPIDQTVLASIPLENYVCTDPPYKLHVYSTSPLVIYLEDFITPEERGHLLSMAMHNFRASTVLNNDGNSSVDSIRSSQSTTLWRDPVVTCVESRALSFQGLHVPRSHVEAIQLVKYAATQHYHFHTDWFGDARLLNAATGGNRITSFFGYIKAQNVTGGGTNFPVLQPKAGEAWCQFVDCDEPYEHGVTFKPIEGNAVFWNNLLDTGYGDMRTQHAGLPVTWGEKIGMNIWTRQGPVPTGWTMNAPSSF